jgi:tRNA threonylcarbamoyladenosine biosynthesis protein TsaE
MKEHIIRINGLEDYPRAAKEFTGFLEKGNIFAFYGKMGSGKTTFIKSICEELGVEDAINSPTFAIVNEYEDRNGRSIFHFDFYRIKSIAEVYNMGYEEYIYSDALCFMEWPELIEELLPEECTKVYIEEGTDGSRTVRIVEQENL